MFSLIRSISSLLGNNVSHQEARVLAQALKVGHPQRYLRPLPASRRRRLRADMLAEVAAVKKVRPFRSIFHRSCLFSRDKRFPWLPAVVASRNNLGVAIPPWRCLTIFTTKEDQSYNMHSLHIGGLALLAVSDLLQVPPTRPRPSAESTYPQATTHNVLIEIFEHTASVGKERNEDVHSILQ